MLQLSETKYLLIKYFHWYIDGVTITIITTIGDNITIQYIMANKDIIGINVWNITIIITIHIK